jgi:hypothetical protein
MDIEIICCCVFSFTGIRHTNLELKFWMNNHFLHCSLWGDSGIADAYYLVPVPYSFYNMIVLVYVTDCKQ